MKTYSLKRDLLVMQEDLFRFVYKLTVNTDEAFGTSISLKGWMCAVMRNVFTNNYRRIISKQNFIDFPEVSYRLTMPQQG